MGKIDIDVKAVRKVANGLKDDVQTMSDVIRQIKVIEDEIRTAWVSQYTESFIECIEETRLRLEKTEEALDDVSVSLETTAKNVEDTEKRVNDIFFNGFSGGGSGGGGGGGW